MEMPGAAERETFAAVYPVLRKLAAVRMRRERVGDTLSATGLVHEAWLRLAAEVRTDDWTRGEYLRAAATAMRRILVERARRRARLRHGGALARATEEALAAVAADGDDPADTERGLALLALDEALVRLAAEEPRAAEVARLRLFGEATESDVAVALQLSDSTVRRDWRYAKAYLTAELRLGGRNPANP